MTAFCGQSQTGSHGFEGHFRQVESLDSPARRSRNSQISCSVHDLPEFLFGKTLLNYTVRLGPRVRLPRDLARPGNKSCNPVRNANRRKEHGSPHASRLRTLSSKCTSAASRPDLESIGIWKRGYLHDGFAETPASHGGARGQHSSS